MKVICFYMGRKIEELNIFVIMRMNLCYISLFSSYTIVVIKFRYFKTFLLTRILPIVYNLVLVKDFLGGEEVKRCKGFMAIFIFMKSKAEKEYDEALEIFEKYMYFSHS